MPIQKGPLGGDIVSTEIAAGAVTYAKLASDIQRSGMKNRIINGDMRIDQRNAGASVALTAGAANFITDRWSSFVSQSSKATAQQNAGPVTPPAGFTNYLGVTSSSAYTVGSGEIFNLNQKIEGYNIADFGWGTANAQPVTLSFWVRSSLTGTFGGSIICGGSYPFAYTINVANTWEQKTITIAANTAYAPSSTTNGQGIYVGFGLGVSSTQSGTAGSWSASYYYSATGATSVVGTLNATFNITGVQLEAGSTATNFEYRQFTNELQLCQRYFCKSSSLNIVPVNGAVYNTTGMYQTGAMNANRANDAYSECVRFPVTMRAEPSTINFYNTGLSTNTGMWTIFNTTGSVWTNPNSQGVASVTSSGFGVNCSGAGSNTFSAGAIMYYGAWTASSEL